MPRAVPEWIGKSDDHRAPGKVRERIMLRDNRCHLCGNPIQPTDKWDMDHVVALINGGENRESNLRPAHRSCHLKKTAADVAEKAKVASVRKKHLGIKTRPVQKIPSAPFAMSERKARREPKPSSQLPYRALYAPKEETT